MTASPENPPPAKIQFYGRRKGKPLKAGRLGLLDSLLPRLQLSTEQPIDTGQLFPGKGVRLEIGFGSGEHLAHMAQANTDVGFIGSEVFLNGVGSLLRYVAEMDLGNVRVYDNDVRYLLPMLHSNSLERVSLLFPDPWPKTRHAKRRFVGPKMLDEMARLLKDSGEFRVVSDHPVYVEWTLLHAPVHPDFAWSAKSPEDWRIRPADSTPTRYEEKAIAAGRKPAFLTFTRVARKR